MRKSNLYALIAMGTMMFAGCQGSDEEFADKGFITGDNMRTETIVKGSVDVVSKTLSVSVAHPATQTIVVSFAAAPSMVATYNQAYYDNAVMLPDTCYAFEATTATINVGSVKSENITINFTKLGSLDRDSIYVLPVTVSSADIDLLSSARTSYYVFKAGALINVVADIEKNFLTVDWKNASVVSNLSQLTMEALIRARNFDRLISTVMGVESYFLIRIGDAGFPANQIQIATSSGNFPDADSNKGLPTNQWVHVALTYDSKTGEMIIYVNGKEQSRGTKNVGAVNLAKSYGNPFQIGRSYEDSRYLAGEISECRIWNVVRTQSEIAGHIYSVEPTSPGLVAYWKFDDQSKLTVKDYTGNGNDATANKALTWTPVSLPAK